MVPVEGIEPPFLSERDFESRASTSSATRAFYRSVTSESSIALLRITFAPLSISSCRTAGKKKI
jgi:hypothetical protein